MDDLKTTTSNPPPGSKPINQLGEVPQPTSPQAPPPISPQSSPQPTITSQEVESPSSISGKVPRSKKVKAIISSLIIFFILVTVPATVFLVRQRQEIRKKAYPPPSGFCAGSGKSDDPGSGLPGPSDCNGTWCHTSTRNYCCWDQNGNGSWDEGVDACSTGQTQDVTCSGTCITFTGKQGESVTFLKYYSNQNVSCPYGPGSPSSETVTIPNNNYSKCIPDGKCGQLEVNNYCGVCKATGCGGAVDTPTPSPPATPTPTRPPTPTPTPPLGCWDTCTPGTCPQKPQALECQDVAGLRCVNPICPGESNCECPLLVCLDLTATSTELVGGDEVDFTCKGSSGVDQPVNHVEFRAQIDDGDWQSLGTAPTTKTGAEYEGTISYIVPQTGSYQIECRVCTSTDDSACTSWGLAE